MNLSREKFFQRLHNSLHRNQVTDHEKNEKGGKAVLPRGELLNKLEDPGFRLQRFKEIMISQKTEIIDYPGDLGGQKKVWKQIFQDREMRINRIVCSSQSRFHPVLQEAWQETVDPSQDPSILYSDKTEAFLSDQAAKKAFLDYHAGITEVEAGLADTGTLLLIPSPEEPRALSLVPPIHIAVLSNKKIVPDLSEWIRRHRERLVGGLNSPSNMVLISGPSKTADIEKRLVYGVHGPRRLILLIGE